MERRRTMSMVVERETISLWNQVSVHPRRRQRGTTAQEESEAGAWEQEETKDWRSGGTRSGESARAEERFRRKASAEAADQDAR